MTPKITLAFVTARSAPMWEWFVDSICAQTTPEQRDSIQFVFIDGKLWDAAKMKMEVDLCEEVALAATALHNDDRRADLARVVAGRFDYLHIPPKPCAYQGPFRQTTRDMFCAGNTRNTAFIVAQAPYVVFVDDLAVLMPGWFNQVLHAAQDQYVVAGCYKKVKNLTVTPRSDGGFLTTFDEFPAGVDSRWNRGSDGGVVPWHGTGLFGCSFGVPLEAALEVDGNDAACNGQGAEDTDFGIRLERAGWQIFLNRNMLTVESEERHHDGSKLPQERRIVTSDRLPRNYDAYKHVNAEEKYWSDHVMLNRLCNETDRVLPLIGDDLRGLREQYQRNGMVPVPARGQLDWRTGESLKDL